MKVVIGRKFKVNNDPDEKVYIFARKVRLRGEDRIVIEWDYDSTTYFVKDVEHYIESGTWMYVKNFNDYLKICK